MHRFSRPFVCLIAAACVCHARARTCAYNEPCEYYQYCDSGSCFACTPGTFGTAAQCAAYNVSLPWDRAVDSMFLHDELHALVARCDAHAQRSDALMFERAVQGNAERMCNASADGLPGSAPLVLTPDNGSWALTPSKSAHGLLSCTRGSYADARKGLCVKCPGFTTTAAAGATSRLNCNACELGWRWHPEHEDCTRCPTCYTTRENGDSGVTRAETCTPCSVFADDYRRGGCSPFVQAQCVLFVPMADVHATMERRTSTSNTAEYNKHVATEYNKLSFDDGLPPFVRYVYNSTVVSEHALFRAQNFERLVLDNEPKRAQMEWAQSMQGPRAYTGYAYTAGMMYRSNVEHVWQIDNPTGQDADVSMFELSGAHVVPMHNVSISTAARYDMVRAAYEAVLRGVVGSDANAVAAAPDTFDILRYAQATGLVMNANIASAYGASEFKTILTDSNNKMCTDDVSANAPCLAIENKCRENSNICTSRGAYYYVWENTQLYLSNASAIFARIDAAIAAWEQHVEDSHARALACNEERVRLAVNVSATQGTAAVLIEAIEVLGANGAVLLRREVHRTVPPLQTVVHAVNVTVRAGTDVDVHVFTNNTEGTAVTVQTLSGVAAGTVHTIYHTRAGFAICESEDEACCAQVPLVASPLDFERLYATLERNLCRIA